MISKFSFNDTLIFIGNNAVSKINTFLKQEFITQIFILVDFNSRKYCLEKLLNKNKILRNSKIIELPIGESVKSIETIVLLDKIRNRINV